MTTFERSVLRLLLAIWSSVRQAPGVATYDEDEELEREIQEVVDNG